jgi:hypothetical protein
MGAKDAGKVGGIIDGEATQHAELAVDHLPPLLDAPPNLVLVPEAAQHRGKVAPLNGTGIEHVDEFIEEQETRQGLLFTAVAVQLTFGTFVGTRPYTYFENISTSSGRR